MKKILFLLISLSGTILTEAISEEEKKAEEEKWEGLPDNPRKPGMGLKLMINNGKNGWGATKYYPLDQIRINYENHTSPDCALVSKQTLWDLHFDKQGYDNLCHACRNWFKKNQRYRNLCQRECVKVTSHNHKIGWTEEPEGDKKFCEKSEELDYLRGDYNVFLYKITDAYKHAPMKKDLMALGIPEQEAALLEEKWNTGTQNEVENLEIAYLTRVRGISADEARKIVRHEMPEDDYEWSSSGEEL